MPAYPSDRIDIATPPQRPVIIAKQNDIFWCRKPSKKTFQFALKNAPCCLYETYEDRIRPVREADTFLSPGLLNLFFLTTANCHRMPIAEWLSDTLQAHYMLPPSLTMHIHVALQEAISNAVIHGNLGIAGSKNRNEFGAYHSTIQEKLHDRRYCFKRVTIGMARSIDGFIFGVADEGQGYDIESISYGKGLGLIREYSSEMKVLRGGSLIEMHFPW